MSLSRRRGTAAERTLSDKDEKLAPCRGQRALDAARNAGWLEAIESNHSYRRAIIGSVRIARRAGI